MTTSSHTALARAGTLVLLLGSIALMGASLYQLWSWKAVQIESAFAGQTRLCPLPLQRGTVAWMAINGDPVMILTRSTRTCLYGVRDQFLNERDVHPEELVTEPPLAIPRYTD